MFYLVASKPDVIEAIEQKNINYQDYDYYDISTYKVAKSQLKNVLPILDSNDGSHDDSNDDSDRLNHHSKKYEIVYTPLTKDGYYSENDIYIYMANKDDNDYISIQKFLPFVTKSIIKTLETEEKEYYDCTVMLDGSTTQDEYRCRSVKEYKKRIYDNDHDKRVDVGWEWYNSDEDAEPRLIKKFIKQSITVGCCNGKCVTFDVPTLVNIIKDNDRR